MKIVAVRSYLTSMALTKPYTIAYNTFSDVSLAFFEVELENGMVGYGSGSPAEDVVGETTAQTAANLQTDFNKSYLKPSIISRIYLEHKLLLILLCMTPSVNI